MKNDRHNKHKTMTIIPGTYIYPETTSSTAAVIENQNKSSKHGGNKKMEDSKFFKISVCLDEKFNMIVEEI